jgi:hypothetical protein
MPAPTLTRDEAIYEIAMVENALRDGFPAHTQIGSHDKSALRVASEVLRVIPQSLIRRVGIPAFPELCSHYRRFGVAVDWGCYREPPAPLPPAEAAPPPVAAPPGPPPDPIELRRLKDENIKLRSANANLERQVATAEDIRSSVLGLVAEIPRPRLIVPAKGTSQRDGRTVIIQISDVHYGETVHLDEMDGTNCYSAAIAQARLGRGFAKAASLMTEHWTGKPPDKIVLCLGGDLISGDIHEELAQSNYPKVPAATKEVGEHIAGGICLLRKKVKCPIEVYSVPGNHGRLSRKPQSKARALTNLDLLATDFAEAAVRGARVDGITFYQSSSPDAYFSTYDWNWLLTHGDTMGSKGGMGYVGPAATIVRGHRKLIDTSWRSGRAVHYVLTGHLHTTLETTFGWANGSCVGYSEYGRDLRCDPEPARQNFLVVHARHGQIVFEKLNLGHPSEGSHYAGPATVVRPLAGIE